MRNLFNNQVSIFVYVLNKIFPTPFFKRFSSSNVAALWVAVRMLLGYYLVYGENIR